MNSCPGPGSNLSDINNRHTAGSREMVYLHRQAFLGFSTLWKYLKVLSNGLFSPSLTLFRRLFGGLLNVPHSCFSRNPISSFLSIYRPADSGFSIQSDASAGVAAISLRGIPTVPANASNNIACSLAPVAMSPLAQSGMINLQSQSHQHSAPPVVPNIHCRRKVPFIASSVQRYGKDIKIEPSSGIESIHPAVRQYPKRHLPTDWEAHVHPEGALYFYHPGKRVFTDTNVQDFLDDLNNCADDLRALAESNNIDLTHIELTLQLGKHPNTGERVCSYYFADRVERTIFWLHKLDTEDLFNGVRGVEEHSHICYVIQSQYWMHCELYPNNREEESQKGLLAELREIIVHASADVITSETSLSPFGGEDLSKILDLIDHLKETTSKECGPYSICVIARFMRYFARAKFLNFCGQSCARLAADQSIYFTDDEHIVKSVISWIMELLCFGAPHAQMKELRRVWVDKNTTSPRWKDFNDKLGREWVSITIYSTVMLTVDLTFLAVPSVNADESQSVTIIAAYLATFCVIGSLVVSILLAGQNRKYGNVSADTAVVFLTRMTNSIFGEKALAILHGLPFALLMWGMIFFLIAFSSLVFKSTSDILRGIVGCGLLIIILLILWPIWSTRDYHVFSWLRERLALSE
ncbi:uncharacterized protein F5891DRAFT_1065336 [Suillus fuscotomentosus]|uniref:Uncharacterized protein n=1 Tax=Suillus fuscotomentosus TaxID=1912939 RepID=A0AAD4HEZ1_9AGAM|nr:uncharacterized protein F5891DRAFT_1065336 [Suillus fuscotomentosus]KAG1893726.1 hypothetical protein F5891DRAFT_1065336 [Suillus fuscotomentosus]